jgi:hypothetical protein
MTIQITTRWPRAGAGTVPAGGKGEAAGPIINVSSSHCESHVVSGAGLSLRLARPDRQRDRAPRLPLAKWQHAEAPRSTAELVRAPWHQQCGSARRSGTGGRTANTLCSVQQARRLPRLWWNFGNSSPVQLNPLAIELGRGHPGVTRVSVGGALPARRPNAPSRSWYSGHVASRTILSINLSACSELLPECDQRELGPFAGGYRANVLDVGLSRDCPVP